MKTEVDDRTWAEINGYRYGGIDEAFIGRVLETHIPHPRYRSDSQTNPAEVFRHVIMSPYCRAQIEPDFWCEVIVHGDRPGADGWAHRLGVGRWRIGLWRHCSTVTPVHEAAHVLASDAHTPEWHQFYRGLLLDRYDFDPELWLVHAEKALGRKQTVPPEMDSSKYRANWSRPSYMWTPRMNRGTPGGGSRRCYRR